jgi:hypothetical protein
VLGLGEKLKLEWNLHTLPILNVEHANIAHAKSLEFICEKISYFSKMLFIDVYVVNIGNEGGRASLLVH